MSRNQKFNSRKYRSTGAYSPLIPAQRASTALSAYQSSNDLRVDALEARRELPAKLIYVESLADLPDPVGGVITLLPNRGYFFTELVDVGSNQVEWGASTNLIGISQESAGIVSTATTTIALIKSRDTAPARFIRFEATNRPLFDMDGSVDPNSAIDWVFVNIADTPDMGTIKDYGNLIGLGIGFLASEGLVLDGSFGTVGFDNTILRGSGSGTILTVPPTATITRRIRFTSCAFIAFASSTALDISATATIPSEGFVLQNCAFSGGATYFGGLDFTDDKTRFEGNRGIQNTAVQGNLFMQNNTVATTISAASTPVKAAGVTTAGTNSQKFTLTDNRATYDGALERLFAISVTCTASSSAGPEMGLYIAKNGVVDTDTLVRVELGVANRVSNVVTFGTFLAAQNDFFEVWIENEDNTLNITVEDLKMNITQIG